MKTLAFEGLSERLEAAFKRLKSKGSLNEADVRAAMRDVRMALLEADVSYKVAKDFTAKVTERAIGADVMESLTPAQMVIKIVNEELIDLMGGTKTRLATAAHPPTVIMLCGLQGAGKTTHCAKLALMLKNRGSRPMLVACDIYRPAAIKQLQVLGEKVGVPVFEKGTQDPVETAKQAVALARDEGNDYVLIDTAGRLHIDEQLMDELKRIKSEVRPHEILLVVDAMTGQDAVNTAKAFNERLPLTGVVLTKIDGDSRGGAALSVRHVTGKPIKFVGTAEKLTGFDAFDPEAMASRILGMGDIVGLVKDVQKSINITEAEKLAQKISQGDKFDLNDFRAQLSQMNNMESFSSILEKLPAQFQEAASKVNDEEAKKSVRRTMGIIDSMTPFERRKPDLIKASRKKRIAAGAGVPVQEVNRLLKQFEQTQDMMKRMKRGGLGKMMRALGQFGRGGFPGMGSFGR